MVRAALVVEGAHTEVEAVVEESAGQYLLVLLSSPQGYWQEKLQPGWLVVFLQAQYQVFQGLKLRDFLQELVFLQSLLFSLSKSLFSLKSDLIP